MADSPVSYIQSTAQERLAIQQAQLLQKYTEDSIVNRNLKELKRGDFEQQVQPLYANVQLKEGISGGVGGKTKPWQRLTASRSGRTGVNYGTQQVNYMTPNNPGAKSQGGGGTGPAVRYHTGRTTIVDKAATWTTEGAIENKFQPREQHRQMILRSLLGDKGMVYNKVLNQKTGETEWKGGMMQFGQNGELTPITSLSQKEKGAQMLADKFKKGRQAQTDTSVSAYPTLGRQPSTI